MRNRLRQLHALAHALAVRADALAGGLFQVHLLQRGIGGTGGVGVLVALQPKQRDEPFKAGHAVVKRILFGANAHAQINRGVAPDRRAEHAHRALVGFELPGDQFEQRRFAGAVGTK